MTVALQPSEPILRPDQDFGTYRIVRMLGRGGMGEVYEAIQQETGRRVALKVMKQALGSTTDRKRFLREGRLAASINHPNVGYIFGSEEVEYLPVIIMELAPHGTLRDRVSSGGSLSVAAAVDATLQLIDGLEAAHAGGILHRDVKPENCFLDYDGAVKIGDFGLSISTYAHPESALTQVGTLLGTPAFASPEQLRAETLGSDIYSVGATLYYLLTGRAPFEGKEFIQLLSLVLQQVPRAPHELRKDIPRSLSRVVLRCLAKAAPSRYPDYQSLRKALVPFASTAARPITVARRAAAGMIDAVPVLLPEFIPAVATASATGAWLYDAPALAAMLGVWLWRVCTSE